MPSDDTAVPDAPVRELRAFNRFYTNLIGTLDYSRHLHAPYTLTEARVLYELAHAQGSRRDAADLRTELSLDAGYLSRLLTRFEKDGLVERAPAAHDPRRRTVTLTARGRDAAELLDARSQEQIDALLATVAPADRTRLTQAVRTIRDVLSPTGQDAAVQDAAGRDAATARGAAGPEAAGRGPAVAPPAPGIRLRPPHPGDLGWIIQRNAALYASEHGWNEEYETLVARIVADYAAHHDPGHERVWMAEHDGRRVGCVMCVRDGTSGEPAAAPGAAATARLRLLLVEPDARGLGVGDLLVTACVDFARAAGYTDLVLWTNDVLTAARRIYRRHGFTLTAEAPHHSFGRDLVGQDWHLPLQP